MSNATIAPASPAPAAMLIPSAQAADYARITLARATLSAELAAPLTPPQWQDRITLAGRQPDSLSASERGRVSFYAWHDTQRASLRASEARSAIPSPTHEAAAH